MACGMSRSSVAAPHPWKGNGDAARFPLASGIDRSRRFSLWANGTGHRSYRVGFRGEASDRWDSSIICVNVHFASPLPLSIFSSHSNRVSATAVSGCQETGFWRWRRAAETAVDFQLKSVTETQCRDEIRPRGGYFAESREISADYGLGGGARRTQTGKQLVTGREFSWAVFGTSAQSRRLSVTRACAAS